MIEAAAARSDRRVRAWHFLGLWCLLQLVACAPQFERARATVQEASVAADVYVTSDGIRLPLRVYAAGPYPKAVVVALHGFNDYSRFIEDAARYFAEAGIQTVAYDQRGFGGAPEPGIWAGAGTMTDDFLIFLRLLRQDHPQVPLFVLGESMGAAVAAAALAQAPATDIDGVILSAPAVWSRDTMPWYQRAALWTAVRLFPSMTVSGKGIRIVPSDNLAMRIELGKDPLVIKETRIDALYGLSDLMDRAMAEVPRVRHRTLFIYGLKDQVIPREPVIALFERWPQTRDENFRFGLYPEGYHMLLRDLQRRVVWNDVVSWMLSPGAVLPSGHEYRREAMLRQLQKPGD